MKLSNLGQYSYWLGDHLATPSVAAMGLDTGAALKEGSVSRPAPSTCICIVQAATSGRPCLLSIQPTRRGQKVNPKVQPQPTLSWTILRTFMECHSIHFNFRWTGLPRQHWTFDRKLKQHPKTHLKLVSFCPTKSAGSLDRPGGGSESSNLSGSDLGPIWFLPLGFSGDDEVTSTFSMRGPIRLAFVAEKNELSF